VGLAQRVLLRPARARASGPRCALTLLQLGLPADGLVFTYKQACGFHNVPCSAGAHRPASAGRRAGRAQRYGVRCCAPAPLSGRQRAQGRRARHGAPGGAAGAAEDDRARGAGDRLGRVRADRHPGVLWRGPRVARVKHGRAGVPSMLCAPRSAWQASVRSAELLTAELRGARLSRHARRMRGG